MSFIRTATLVLIAILIGVVDFFVPLGFGESFFEILQAVFIFASVWSAGES